MPHQPVPQTVPLPPSQQVGPPIGPVQPTGPTGLQRFAKRLGKAGISLATGIPAIELDRRIATNKAIETQTLATQQETETQRIAAEKEAELQRLSQIAFAPGGGAEADAALNQIFARDPLRADRLFESIGARDQASREEAARDAAAIQALPFEKRRAAILERAARIEAQGRDASDTLTLLDMDEETQTNQLRILQAAALTQAQRTAASREGATPAEQETFEALIAGFSDEDKRVARRIKAGLDPRAVGSAAITTAVTEDLTEQVAESEAVIRQRTKFAEMTGTSRAKAIDAGFDSIKKIDGNIRNLDKAVAALDGGAQTGAVISRFTPTIRASTVALEQIQKTLALDVINSATFGPLSERELALALATALPTGLQPAELREWIVNRQAAQTKLRGYLSDQIDFLDQGGSIAGFLRSQQRAGGGNGDTLRFDETGAQIQ